MNKKVVSILLASCIALTGGLLSSCGTKNASKNTSSKVSSSESASNEKSVTDFTVNSAWLKANLDNETLVIIDARSDKLYSKDHIPHAQNVAWQSLSFVDGKSSDKNWGTVLKQDNLQSKIQNLGINAASNIVIYTDTTKGWGDDGRILWTLKTAGLKNVRLLDGGMTQWKKDGNELTSEITNIDISDFKIDEMDYSMTISTKDLSKKLDSYKIIDTRSKSEFDGAQKYGELRGGHIPGAVNIEFNQFINKNGSLKSQDEIEKILSENDISKSDTIVTYCTAGIRSAHMAIVLKEVGYENVLNYDESIYAWAADDSLEMVK